jgi:hypothetical protein
MTDLREDSSSEISDYLESIDSKKDGNLLTR